MIKKLLSIIFVLTFPPQMGLSQTVSPLLQEADSLFSQQQFTQSFLLYDSIYQFEQEASPSMLLKMAYIKEGLGDVTIAQYYLNEYYLATSNELALQKMEDLADANDLTGYQHNDITFFFNLYYKNYNWLVLGLILICLVLFSVIVYQKRKYKTSPWFNGFMLLLLLASLFVLVNFGKDYNRGVIIKNNTFIMAAPSSGADLVDVTTKGHKVIVEGKKDVWYKIEWQDGEGYVKAKNVKLLTIW
jgi:SH3 domain-containing protein